MRCVRCHEAPAVDGARLCSDCLGTPMDQATYRALQQQIQTFSGLLVGLDLEGFRKRLSQADNVAWFLDPTAYRDALQSGKLDLVKSVAGALHEAQRKILKAETEFAGR